MSSPPKHASHRCASGMQQPSKPCRCRTVLRQRADHFVAAAAVLNRQHVGCRAHIKSAQQVKYCRFHSAEPVLSWQAAGFLGTPTPSSAHHELILNPAKLTVQAIDGAHDLLKV